MIVRREGSDETHADFRVCREQVLRAIQWLQRNKPCYSDITINYTNLHTLPENGTPHNPGLMQKAALPWSVQQEINAQGTQPTQEQQKILQEGLESTAKVLDWPCNESYQDNHWSFSDPYPCSVNFSEVDEDYNDLVNSVERHTHCSPAYCLKKKVGQTATECRFKFPRPLLTNSLLTFEKLTDGSIRGTFIDHQT